MSKESVLAHLKGLEGSETGVGNWQTVDQQRINLFADATGDHQWIHINPEKAKNESPYKDTIAHGFLTLSMIPGLTQEIQGSGATYEGVKLAVNYGLNRVRFPAPVPVNSRLRARTRLLGVEEAGGALQLTREITVEVENGDKPCCVAESLTRLYF